MYSRKNRETKQRFTIKKFKVGAASVLIGTLFVGFAGQVKADTSVSESTADLLVSASDPLEASVVGEEGAANLETPAVVAQPKAAEKQPELAKTADEVAPEAPTTRGYAVKPSEKPATSAAERPAHEGETIPTGFSFRTDGAPTGDAAPAPATDPASAESAADAPAKPAPTVTEMRDSTGYGGAWTEAVEVKNKGSLSTVVGR